MLTAAHCVQPGATYKIVEYGADRQPQLQDVNSVAIHPGFNMQAMLAHRATADVALLQLEMPAREKSPAALGVPQLPIAAGQPVHHRRYRRHRPRRGQQRRTIRVAGLVATGKPGTLQIRLVDPLGQGARMGLAPVPAIPAGRCSRTSGAAPIVGVISWSTGPNGSAGCGGLTGVTPLTLYRDWIVQTARQWGSAL